MIHPIKIPIITISKGINFTIFGIGYTKFLIGGSQANIAPIEIDVRDRANIGLIIGMSSEILIKAGLDDGAHSVTKENRIE